VVSANTAFSACEVSGHETLKVSHVNPGPDPTPDANATAVSIDLQAGKAGGSAAQGIFLKSTTGGTSGKIMNYVDSTGETIFALLPDGSLLFRSLAAPPRGTNAGLKLCNVNGSERALTRPFFQLLRKDPMQSGDSGGLSPALHGVLLTVLRKKGASGRVLGCVTRLAVEPRCCPFNYTFRHSLMALST
jgi:hypothetical protein